MFQVLEEYGLEPDLEGAEADLNAIEKHYTDNGGYFGVVIEAKCIVATIGLYRVDDSTCELRNMYVFPDQRRNGLEGQLLKFAQATSRQMGFQRIILETVSSLEEAVDLYTRFGFQEYESEHMAARCDMAMELILE